MPKDILLHDYDRVRSISLEELLAEREPFMQRALRYGRHALLVWALVSLLGAVGAGTFYAFGGSDEPILVSQAEDAPAPADIPARIEAAAVRQAAPPPQPAETPTLAMMRPAEIAQPVIIEARLPRPRPDEPLYTGSIRQVRGPYIPVARNEPCETLARLGIPFQLRIGCGRQARYVAPPERRVYYRAY